MDENEINSEIEIIIMKDFLEKTPPESFVHISNVYESTNFNGYKSNYISIPEIYIHCEDQDCKGLRFYKPTNDSLFYDNDRKFMKYVEFFCKNCQKGYKLFSLFSILAEDNKTAKIIKIGEYPRFGQPTSSKLIELIGPDRDYFLRGRRCENLGLGIGSFTYYRRVVENQKNRIFDKIIDVAKKVNPTSEIIQELEIAKKESQFSKAIENVKHAIPESLLIDGHNPLTLIHSALSEGVHDKTDKECLELASSVRVVLAELAQKASQALKNDAEVSSALSKLMNRKKQEKTKK